MGLGTAVAGEVREAWSEVYGMLATAMKRGAATQMATQN